MTWLPSLHRLGDMVKPPPNRCTPFLRNTTDMDNNDMTAIPASAGWQQTWTTMTWLTSPRRLGDMLVKPSPNRCTPFLRNTTDMDKNDMTAIPASTGWQQTWTTMTWLPSPHWLGDNRHGQQWHDYHPRVDWVTWWFNLLPGRQGPHNAIALTSPFTSSTTTTINSLPGEDCAVFAEGKKAATTMQWSDESENYDIGWLKNITAGIEPTSSPPRISHLSHLCYAPLSIHRYQWYTYIDISQSCLQKSSLPQIMYVLQFFVTNIHEICPKYSKSHVLKIILLIMYYTVLSG